MAEILTSITELPVGDIVMGNRLRPVSKAGVEAIKASIFELGVMKDPIHVRRVRHRGGEYVLMAGGHRLVSAQELGWETIKVTCWECNDDFAQLMEIDDNLAGAELTALDTAVFLAARKTVYERLHPEAKHGGARGNQHTGGWQTDTMSFCQTTAEKFGLTAHVQRYIEALGPERTVDFLLEFGGARLYLATDPAGRSEIEQLLGRDKIQALCALRPGEVIAVPTARPWLAHVLKARGLPKNTIARTLKVSHTAIDKYLRQPADGSSGQVTTPRDTRQLRLF